MTIFSNPFYSGTRSGWLLDIVFNHMSVSLTVCIFLFSSHGQIVGLFDVLMVG